MRNKAYPYPEIVSGETGWTVVGTPDNNGNAFTNNQDKHMEVPLDRNCEYCGVNHSGMIRRHELGHVKWSPKTKGRLQPGVRVEALDVLEEIRIGYLLYRAKLGINEPVECIDKLKVTMTKMVYEDSIASCLLMSMAALWPTNDTSGGYGNNWSAEWQAFKQAADILIADPNVTDLRKAEIQFVKTTAMQFYRDITSHRYGQTPSYRKVQKHAKRLSSILDMFLDTPEKDDVYKPQPKLGSSTQHTAQGMDEDEGEEEIDGDSSIKDLERRMRKGFVQDMMYATGRGSGTWGEMIIHEPPLTTNLQSRLRNGRAYRPADFGYSPKYINRWCTDKKIFKQKIRVLGGTILIDASGSMSFSADDLLEIMMLLPAATIAMYNGTGHTGDLRIIARNGYRVDQQYLDDHTGMGNVIDGPALHWLATQKPRRIWVSDMKVFGAHGDTAGYNLMRDVQQTCLQNGIINLKDIEEVKEHAIKLNIV